MAKLTAWLVTIIGVLLVLRLIPGLEVIGDPTEGIFGWIIALAVLVVGIGKLVRNYKKRGKR